MTGLPTFDEAIEDSNAYPGGRTLLLGNGFSIDWDPGSFHYRSLFDEASFDGLNVDQDALFGLLETHDFESVIGQLRSSADLLDLYGCTDADLADSMRKDAQTVKLALSDAIAKRHPDASTRLSNSEAQHVAGFLRNFERVFTVNYDLLLYWALNSGQLGHQVPRQDGFEWLTADGGGLVWKRSAADRGQQVFYLHGALHYFVESDRRLHKLSYGDSGRLVSQVKERILNGSYPLIVTEGRTTEKVARIRGDSYLTYCHDRFADLAGNLFIHGMSLSPNDDHILAALESKESNVERLYVSIYDSDTSSATHVLARSNLISERRHSADGRRLIVNFYDANTGHVWR